MGLLNDIPFADISPERLKNGESVPIDLINNYNQQQPYSRLISPTAKIPLSSPNMNKRKDIAGNNPSLLTTMPALQLFCLSNTANAAAGLNSARGADVLDLKLRRRYAHEWEFLATVLDRVLLILFSGLVVLVSQ